jgi:hypothetical protein
MPPHRRYTKVQKAEAVAVATMTSTEAAAETLGIPRKTIEYWEGQPEFAELRLKSRDDVADQFWAAIQIGLREVGKALTDPDEKLSAKSIALGILYDKHALLTGGATGRTESRELNDLPDSAYVEAIHEWQRLAGPSGERSETAPAEEPAG